MDLVSAFRELVIETPSWGHEDLPQAGRPRDVFERVEDAAEVHRLTGTAGAMALRFPPDAVEDRADLRWAIEERGLRAGAPRCTLGPAAALLECVEIAAALGAPGLALWPADGTSFAGQDDLRERRRRLLDGLGRVYAELPAGFELLLAYEPASDLADWGTALLTCLTLGPRARVLVETGLGSEQIVALLALEGRLGGLVSGAVNPFEQFLAFVELAALDELPRLAIAGAQSVEAIVLSVVNLQEAYAKALLVDRAALQEAQEFGDALCAHEVLLDAYKTDVRDACARARVALGAAHDPVVALRQSDYVERKAVLR
jgi:L-rhamnose isomerase/sugar isomerase